MRRVQKFNKIGISQFFQLSFNVELARRLPIPILKFYMYFWGLIYVLIRLQLCKNIAACLFYIYRTSLIPSPFLLNWLRSILGVFEHYFEKMVMAYKSLDELQDYLNKRLLISNRHFLDELASKGKGAILVTGHFGAVEYLPLSLAMNGYKVAMICKFKTQTLKKALMEKAAQFGVQLIDASEPGVAFKALRAIKEGRFLITECDEFSEWRFHKTQRVTVFGKVLPRDRTLDFFFKKAKVPTFLTLMKRDGNRFNMVVEFLSDGIKHDSISAKAWKKLEEYICAYPFQWYQIKGTAKFLKTNAIEVSIEAQKDNHIPDKDTVFSPSYS